MARMRAQTYVKQEAMLFQSMGQGPGLTVHELGNGQFPRQLKNIRGDLQFTTADTTPTSADAGAGYVALVRWPASEAAPGLGDIALSDPRVLHPVPWQFRLYPSHVRYEFKGINLGQRDRLYIIVRVVSTSGSDNIYFDFAFLWAQLNHVATN